MGKQRLIYIDLLKCFAIFLVVWQHYMSFFGQPTTIEATISRTILSFHMPLFGILSGFFLDLNLSSREFFTAKTRQLLVPFLVWILISEIILQGGVKFLNFINGGDSLHVKGFMNAVVGSVMEYRLWFVKALYLCFCLSFLGVRIAAGRLIIGLIGSVIVLYLISLLEIIPNQFPLTIGFVFLYPFFCFGYFLRLQQYLFKRHLKIILWTSLLLFLVLLTKWNGFPDCFYYMNTSIFAPADQYGNEGLFLIVKILYRILIGLSGSIFFISLFHLMCFKLESPSGVVQALIKVGQYTLPIYILHSYLFEYFSFGFVGMNPLVHSIFILLLTVAVICVSIIIYRITSVNKYLKFMLWGKL